MSESTVDLHELITNDLAIRDYLKRDKITLNLSSDANIQLNDKYLNDTDKCESAFFDLGFINLVGEMEIHNKNSLKKIITTLNSETNTTNIEILTTGKILTEEKIQTINERYQEGARKAEYGGATREFHGTHWIGYYFGKINAVVKIENCDEGEFSIKNTIELPKQK